MNNYNEKIRYFVHNEIEKTYHVTHTKTNPENKTITIDIIVEKYQENLDQIIIAKLKKYDLQDSKVEVFQTLKAVDNKSEIENLQKQLADIKKELEKLK